jgi:hypothetical protein
MRKWIFRVVLLLLLVLITLYFFIPSPKILSDTVAVNTNSNGAYRVFCGQKTWDTLGNGHFTINKRLLNTVELTVSTNGLRIPVSLLLVPLRNDSTIIQWTSDLPAITGPFAKLKKYSLALDIKKSVDNTLSKFANYLKHDENVYGYKINQQSTVDTMLVAVRFKTATYPTLAEIYQHIHQLENYLQQKGATRTGYPMLNTTMNYDSTYKCMVAIPINKKIDDSGDLFFVRMVPARFLTMEFKGGPYSIRHAHQVMQQYFADYKRVAMAIPFEYLVTDRETETDTTKWVTRIYAPVY